MVDRQLRTGKVATDQPTGGRFLITLPCANSSASVWYVVARNRRLHGERAKLRRWGNCWDRKRNDNLAPRAAIDMPLTVPDASFLDEATLNLDAMEAALADLSAAADLNAVHALFRHAHSIKGGAAAYSLEALADLMHSIESVLDVARTTGVVPDGATAELLREAVEAGRHMLTDDVGPGIAFAQDVTNRLRQRVLTPATYRDGAVRCITVRSPETDVVSAAVISLFSDIAGLGELLSVNRGVGGEQLFVVRTSATDHELLDLLAMHVERGNVSITAVPAKPVVRRAIAAGGVSARAASGKTVRVDTIALRCLVLLARKLARASATSEVLHLGAQSSRQQQGIEALCQGLEDLGYAPVASLFGRIPPQLQRLSGQLNKQFELSVTGEDVRIERAVLQCLADPLMHLVRNACDHGIELSEQRMAVGKPRVGKIDLSAWQEPGWIRISVRDDGGGLSRDKVLRAAREREITLPADLDDHAVWQLVFVPGLSTAHGLSQVSGRGVGMDAVLRQVASIGGDVSITSSAGKGVCVTMSFPADDALE